MPTSFTPASVESPAVVSPCIKVCALDASDICTGCGRTLAEIAGWSRMSQTQQRDVCERAAGRLRAQATAG